MKPASESPAEQTLQCMEIWGGSDAVEKAVATPGLEAWVYSKPFEGSAQGGDVHYVSHCGGGVITRMIVADVSGYGQAVAEFSRALRELMRRNINRKSQTKLVASLNRQFAAPVSRIVSKLPVKADLIASHHCYANEMKPALERHSIGKAKVIPIILLPRIVRSSCSPEWEV
jgi:hypothetical protein